MKFKEINPININIKSFSDFFSSQTKEIDKGYNNYLLGKRDCTVNDFFQYNIDEIETAGGNDCAGICPKIMDKLFGDMVIDTTNTFNARIMSQGDNLLVNYLDYSSDPNTADTNIMNIFNNMYKAKGIDKSIIASITDYDTKKARILEIINDCANNGHYILDSFYNVKIYVNNIINAEYKQAEIDGSFKDETNKQNNNTTGHPVYNFHCIVNKTASINTEATISSLWSGLLQNSGTYSFKVSICMGIPTYTVMQQLLFNYMFNTSLNNNSRTTLYNFIMKCKENLDKAIELTNNYNGKIFNDGLDNHGYTNWKPDLSIKSGLMANIAWSMGLDYNYVTDSNRENKIPVSEIPSDGAQIYYWLRRDINDWFLISPPEVAQIDRQKEFVNNTDIVAYIENGIKKLFGSIGWSTTNVRPVLTTAINTSTSSDNIINIFKTLYNYNNYASDSKSYIDTDDKIIALLYECVKKGKCIYDSTLGVKIYITKPFSGTATNTNNLFTLYSNIETLYNNQIYNGKVFVTIKVGTKQNEGADPKYTSWSVIENPKYIFVDDAATAQSTVDASIITRNGLQVPNQFVFSRPSGGRNNQIAISQETYSDHRNDRVKNYNLSDSSHDLHKGNCMIVLRAWGDTDWTGKYENYLRIPNAVSTKSQMQDLDGCMSHEDKYFIDSLKEKLGWSDSSKEFSDSTFGSGDYSVIVTELSNEVNDMKDKLNLS